MLSAHPIDPMILATDLGVAREFYAEVADLRSRGVEVADSADVGFALATWFVDPHGNSIGLLQFKDPEAG